MTRFPSNVVTVQPTGEPVSLEEVCRNAFVIDGDDEQDQWIREAIPVARRIVEQLANKSLLTQTRRQSYDWLPSEMDLRYGPVQSVTSITYIDTDGETIKTLDSLTYRIDVDSVPPRITPEYNAIWPSVTYITNAVQVTYVAGYGDNRTDVPLIYRRAIILLVTHWFHNRDQLGCVDDGMTDKLQNLLAIEGATTAYV